MDQNPFMMAGGMPPQGMQRPQAGNENDQIHAKIMEELRKTAVPQGVWQSTVDPRERAQWIMQMYVARTPQNSKDKDSHGLATHGRRRVVPKDGRAGAHSLLSLDVLSCPT